MGGSVVKLEDLPQFIRDAIKKQLPPQAGLTLVVGDPIQA